MLPPWWEARNGNDEEFVQALLFFMVFQKKV